jgi:SAM-dependent methyltransferase
MLTGFRETLGRPGTTTPWLNPGALTDAEREQLRRRAQRGALVSEHETVAPGEWLPGALRDRMSVAHHVELLGSLLPLRAPRVLEIRPRTGAILEALRRQHGASVFALPIFESQQEMVRGLYGISADALIDFERFHIPYEGPFDLVVSNHMLTHAIAPGDFLDTISVALAPGGHLYLYNEMDEVEFLADSKSIFRVMNPFHMQVFTPVSLSRALAARGFEVAFLGHTDRIQMMCLARKAAPVVVPMPKDERKRRLRQYTVARDFAILSLPDDRRGPFEREWNQVVERAVLAGTATLDERGRVQLRGASSNGESEDEHDD